MLQFYEKFTNVLQRQRKTFNFGFLLTQRRRRGFFLLFIQLDNDKSGLHAFRFWFIPSLFG